MGEIKEIIRNLKSIYIVGSKIRNRREERDGIA